MSPNVIVVRSCAVGATWQIRLKKCLKKDLTPTTKEILLQRTVMPPSEQ